MQTGAASGSPADKRQIAYYCALCLLALGRSDEADRALEVAALADPFYRLKDTEASPSVRARAGRRRASAPSRPLRGGFDNEVKDSFGRRDYKDVVQRATLSRRSSTTRRQQRVPKRPRWPTLVHNAGFLEVSRKSLEMVPLPTTALGNNPAPAPADTSRLRV